MGEIFQWLVGFLDREWAVTRQAWKPLIVLMLIFGGILLYGASKYYAAFYEETLRTLEQRRAYEERLAGEATRRIAVLEARPNTVEEAEARIGSLTQAYQQLQEKFDVLKQQTTRRMLTDGQKEKLMEVLNKVPSGITYKLTFHTILNCDDCSMYMTDLAEVWGKVHGWEVGGGPHFGLDPRLIGVFVLVGTENCPAEEIHLVISALNAAEIEYEGKKAGEKFGPGCFLLVGSRAQQ